jgi:hypothetical protein
VASFCSACGQPLAPGMKFCGHCGAATAAADVSVPLPPPPMGSPLVPRCQTCGSGTLRLEKTYRMSTPVVAIGYIILVPSLLWIIGCVTTMFRLSALPSSDGSSMATGMLFFLAVLGFVSGLLGWLLIMKKKVLRCTHCSATVQAS